MSAAASEAVPFSIERLGAVVVKDLSGVERRLGEVWAENPAVISFVRHFG